MASEGPRERNVLMAARIERTPVAGPVRFVVAGDSGAWPDPTADGIFAQLLSQIGELDSHFRGICTEGHGRPEDRGGLYHCVELTISEAGAVSGRVVQAFDRAGTARSRFGGDTA